MSVLRPHETMSIVGRSRVDGAAAAVERGFVYDTHMNRKLSPKPKLSREEMQARKATQLRAIRLRITIDCALDDRGITIADRIGIALGLPAAEATALLRRRVVREGDLVQLEAAARLGL